MFATPAAANTAIRDTIAKARADGDKWPDKYGIYLLTVEDAPPNAELRGERLRESLSNDSLCRDNYGDIT